MEGTPLDIYLPASDAETSSRSELICSIVDRPANGRVTYSYESSFPNNSYCVTFTPHNGFTGTNTFTYMVSDYALESAVATCTVVVAGNTPPIADNMAVDAVEQTPLNIALSVSDQHASASYLECMILTNASNGLVTYRYPDSYPVSSRYITYTPDPGFIGTDTFWYAASDGSATSDAARVTVAVSPNTQPTAYATRFVVSPGGEGSHTLEYLDPDSGQTRLATVVTHPSNGVVTVWPSSLTVTYTPTNGFTGTDMFQVSVSDGVTNSRPVWIRVQVRDRTDRAGNLVAVVVNELLLPNISNRVYRLKSDLENEGYTALVKPWPSSGLSNNTFAVWTYLNTMYTNTAQWFSGAILIGNLPKPTTTAEHPHPSIGYGTYYAETVYWNMREFQNTGTIDYRHIWLSRINVDDTSWGSYE